MQPPTLSDQLLGDKSQFQAYMGNTSLSQLSSKLPLIPTHVPDGYHILPCTYPDGLSAASLPLLSGYFCKLFPDQIQEMTLLYSKNNRQ